MNDANKPTWDPSGAIRTAVFIVRPLSEGGSAFGVGLFAVIVKFTVDFFLLPILALVLIILSLLKYLFVLLISKSAE